MSDIAIKVDNLSKRYSIGARRNAQDGLRHRLEAWARNPWKWLKTVRQEKQAAREDFWALRDVSFNVKKGEVIGVIGRNGAGKSTLLKILSRITEPTSGEITIAGRVASLLEVGTGFHPELTGRENIFLNGAILGMTRVEIKQKFDEIVAFSEVEKFLDTPVKRYSSGMYVRLAFAVAAHLEPEILIVDEVLAVGDVQFQKKCLGKIGEVARGGRTVLFVSHTMTAVKSLTSRAILMEKGRVVCDAEPHVAIGKYLEMSSGNSQDGFVEKSKGKHTTITNVKLLDSSGKLTDYYIPGTNFWVEIHFTTNGTPGMSLELFLSDSHQSRLALASTYQFNGVFLPEKPGNYICKLRLEPMWLASGSYNVNVATSRVNSCWDHEIDRALTFNVPFSNPKGLSWDFKYSEGYGAFAWVAQEKPEMVFVEEMVAEGETTAPIWDFNGEKVSLT